MECYFLEKRLLFCPEAYALGLDEEINSIVYSKMMSLLFCPEKIVWGLEIPRPPRDRN